MTENRDIEIEVKNDMIFITDPYASTENKPTTRYEVYRVFERDENGAPVVSELRPIPVSEDERRLWMMGSDPEHPAPHSFILKDFPDGTSKLYPEMRGNDVELVESVKEGMSRNTLASAVKDERISPTLVSWGMAGRTLQCYNEKDELVETTRLEPGYCIITRCDENGVPVLTDGGHSMQEEVSADYLESRYGIKVSNMVPGLQLKGSFNPLVEDKHYFIEARHDFAIVSTTGLQVMDAGAYIDVTGVVEHLNSPQGHYMETPHIEAVSISDIQKSFTNIDMGLSRDEMELDEAI